MIPGGANTFLLAAGGAEAGLEIPRSLRLNRADAPSLYRTTAFTPSNGQRLTVSFWIKRSELCVSNNSQRAYVYYNGNSVGTGTLFLLEFNNDKLAIWLDGTSYSLLTNALFVDTTAWMHVLVSLNSPESIASDRLKIFINGTRLTSFSTQNYPNSFYTYAFMPGNEIWITDKLNQNRQSGCYLADYYFIDGQALLPDSFAETLDNVFSPKAYTGTYGSNGFHLDFGNNSSATSFGIGQDVSPNGNHFDLVNISVSAGEGDDSLTDTPTSYGIDAGVGGSVRGNFSTINAFYKGTAVVPSSGNLDIHMLPADPNTRGYSTLGMSSGKWYCEFTHTSGTTNEVLGLASASAGLAQYPGYDSTSWGYEPSTGLKYTGGMGSTYADSMPGMVAYSLLFNADTGVLSFFKDGTDLGAAFTGLTAGPYFFAIGNAGEFSGSFNFGQRPFSFTPPSGYKSLCTQNMSAGSVVTGGSFNGTGTTSGPYIYLNGVPDALTINGNSVTWGVHANRYASGFRVITSAMQYNNPGINGYSVTAGSVLKKARAQVN